MMRFAAKPFGTSLLTLVLACLLAGCTPPDLRPSPGMGDPYDPPLNDPQISVLAPELRPWLGFQPAIILNDGVSPMQVEVPVRNLVTRKYLIDYRFTFYDENGSQLEPVMGWEMAAFEPKQTVRLTAKALGTEAVTYRLEIKWAR